MLAELATLDGTRRRGRFALVWWLALLSSGAVRANPGWGLVVVALCAVAAGRRGGGVAALAAGFAACLAVFVVAVGTYALLPELAPAVAPAHAALNNRGEATDAYLAELFVGVAICLALMCIDLAPDVRKWLPG
jgi:hypothetical protein